MELRNYLCIRCAYNLVRHEKKLALRMTFEEFSLLAHLYNEQLPINISELASYQKVMRPTMTQRINHLEKIGLLHRFKGLEDKRTIYCALTAEGTLRVYNLSQIILDYIPKSNVLRKRIDADRVLKMVDSMGECNASSADLCLLGLLYLGGHAETINHLVELLGLLQPTVSMALSVLINEGCVRREDVESRSVRIVLTELGLNRCKTLLNLVDGLKVSRSIH